MAEKKRYIIKSLVDNTSNQIGRSIENNLLSLSRIGIKWDQSLIKNMRGIGAMETENANDNTNYLGLSQLSDAIQERYNKTASVAGQNEFIAFFDKNYETRRDFLRKFSSQGEIDFITDTIADDAIVYDELGYFAYPDTKQLYSRLKPEKGKEIIDNLNECYRKVYNAYKFNESNDAWDYFKKFLVDGILAFEIIYAHNHKTNKATDIIGFQELDPITLEPSYEKDNNGNEYRFWYQNKGDKQNERKIPDSNIIYISWSKGTRISRISYVEHLIRSFNMLRTLENSRIIWNIQNSQKRLKFVVPIGTENEIKSRQRLTQLKAEYKEEVLIDDLSGEITVNGQPKFSFAKNFFFPSKEGVQTEVSEMGVAGHDLSDTSQLKFFWQLFVLQSKLPSSRFGKLLGENNTIGIPGSDDTQNREEYSYSLFVKRCRMIFQEIVLKPAWNLFCIKYPEFATNDILKSIFGLKYNEENLFTLAKARKIASDGAQVISSLAGIQNIDGTPFFSMRFLTEKYLGLSEDDYKLNEKYLKEELAKMKKNKKSPTASGDMGGDFGGGDFGGGSDFGGDFGGGDDFGSDEDFGDDEGMDMEQGGEADMEIPEDSFENEPGGGFSDGELE